MMRKFLRLFLLVALSFAGVHAFAQNSAITGEVMDSQGAVVPGAEVRIVEQVQGTTRTVHTGASGSYSAPYLSPGSYRIYVQATNFSTAESNVIPLTVGQTLVFDVHLKPGAAHEEVNVEASSDVLNQSDAALGKPFNYQQIETLPYLANNTLSLLALQPGVLSFDAGNIYSPMAGTIDGARQDQTNITLDGVDNNDANYGDAFTGVLRATRDSLEEFRVTTSGANADAGRSSGAQVALQTKSGTNQIHGTAYYYYRDPAAASNNWFYKQTELNTGAANRSAKVLQDTYGATLGLPIIKNKLFFFGAYEGYKQASDSVVTQVVPFGTGNSTDFGVAPGLRNGTLTYLNTGGTYTTLTPAQIAAMDTGCTSSGTCPNGPGDNAAIAAYYKQYPLANNTTVGDGHNTAGYTFVSPSPVSNITNIVRMDYNITSRQSLFARGNLQSDNTAATEQFPGQLPSSNTFSNNRGIAFGHIWAISDHLTNNARYGLTRYGSNQQSGFAGDYVGTAGTTGIANLNANPTLTSAYLIETINNFVDDFSIVKGRHTIQFGGNDRLIYNDRRSNIYLYRTAAIGVAGLTTGGIANKGTNLDASAAGYPTIATTFNTSYDSAVTELTGLITSASEYFNYSISNNQAVPLPVGTLRTHRFKNFEQEYYLQDQFRVTPKLLLTAGLRYSYLGVPYETNGQEERFTLGPQEFLRTRMADMVQGISYNPTFTEVPAGKANNAPGYWTPGKFDFAPRLAFNYSPDTKTSIRGGFMLAYDHFGMAVVDAQNDYGGYGLNSLINTSPTFTVNSAPRFTSPTTVPANILPAATTATITFPYSAFGGQGAQLAAIDDTLRAPYAEVFNLSVQRELHRGLTVTATYDGRLGRHLVSYEDAGLPENLADPASGQNWYQAATILDKAKDAGQSIATLPNIPYFQDIFPNATYTTGGVTYRGTQAVYGQLTRGNDATALYTLDHTASASPAGQTNRFFLSQGEALQTESAIGVSNYNSLQLSLRHTVNKNFIYDFNYTLSHSLDTNSEPDRGGSTNSNVYTTTAFDAITNAFNPSTSYANSDFDVRHLITADWTIALPYGRGQRFGAGSGTLMNKVLGGWSLAGIVKWNSALPWSVVNTGYSVSSLLRNFDVQIAPVQNTGHHTYIKNSAGIITPNAFTNGGAAFSSFRLPYAGEGGQRNTMRADGYFSVDPGISKSFQTFRKQSFKLTVEAFNVTNATRFATPVVANAGRGGASSFGNYSAPLLNSPRQMQFSGRYYF